MIDLKPYIKPRMLEDANIDIPQENIESVIDEILSDPNILQVHPRKLEKYVTEPPDARTLLNIIWDLGFPAIAIIPGNPSSVPMNIANDKRKATNETLGRAINIMLYYAENGSYVVTSLDRTDPEKADYMRIRVENGHTIEERAEVSWVSVIGEDPDPE